VGAGLALTAMVVGRRAFPGGRHAHAGAEQAGAGGPAGRDAGGGWATCSAPGARWYEAGAGALLGGLYRRMANDLADAVDGISAPAALEVGPGPGHLAVEIARRVPGLRLTGLDLDARMIELARGRATRAGLDDRVAFVVGDVAALPFPDATFDVVTSSFSVHHWPDGPAGFAEILRVLRPGGRAIVYDLSDRWGHFETKAIGLARAAAAGGFVGATTRPFRWPGPLAIVNRLEGPAPPRP